LKIQRRNQDVNRPCGPLLAVAFALLATSASAETITIATGSTGRELAVLRQELDQFTAGTGIDVAIQSTGDLPLSQLDQYQRWFSSRSDKVDVYRMDITWAPQLARNLADLTSATADVAAGEIPALVQSQTINGALLALPYFADAGALYYRKDLLAKYHLPVPTTWEEFGQIAATIMNGERAAGDGRMWGYVFPGAPSEDLTATALEWVAGNGGGSIVESDGTISIDNVKAILAVEVAEKWVGTISPPDVVKYGVGDARGLWLAGEAVFARDWHDLIALSQAKDSPIHDKIGVAELPRGEYGDNAVATLGGWSLGVSRYSQHRDAAIALVRFLASAVAQKTYEVMALGHLPAATTLYDDPEVAKAEPDIATYKRMLPDLVVRPSAQTRDAYGRVSASFATAITRSLKRDAFAEDFLQSYRHELEAMARIGWLPTVARGQAGDTAP
jgi:trehalose/maltose transport system substrate-binding protein